MAKTDTPHDETTACAQPAQAPMAQRLGVYRAEKLRLKSLPRRERPRGEIRNLAAAKADLSGRTAEKGLQVLLAIEARQAREGDAGDCRRVAQLLDTSIHGAHRLAVSLGWLKPKRHSPSGSQAVTPEDDGIAIGIAAIVEHAIFDCRALVDPLKTKVDVEDALVGLIMAYRKVTDYIADFRSKHQLVREETDEI